MSITLVGLAANPLVRKIALYAAIGLLCGWVFKLWLNSHDDKVAKEATDKAAVGIKNSLDREFAIRLDANMQIVNQARKDKEKAEERYSQITSLFDQAFAKLRDIRQAVNERQIIYVKEAAAVPASDLDPALRAISNELAGRTPK